MNGPLDRWAYVLRFMARFHACSRTWSSCEKNLISTYAFDSYASCQFSTSTCDRSYTVAGGWIKLFQSFTTSFRRPVIRAATNPTALPASSFFISVFLYFCISVLCSLSEKWIISLLGLVLSAASNGRLRSLIWVCVDASDVTTESWCSAR